MATVTQTAPQYKLFTRVYSIPLVASSLESIHETLSSNPYTRITYFTAKDLSSSAIKYTEPLQIRLAPLFDVADVYANKAVDVVENRYPYPFKAKPEDVKDYVRERRDSASLYVKQSRDSVHHTVEKVAQSPYHVAQGLDQQLTPLVDILETAVTKLNGSHDSPTSEKYQYRRALAISKNLKDSLYVKSNEQLKQLQESNVLVHKATETAHTITSLASSSLHSAQSRIHSLSDTMLSDLRAVQSSLSAEFSDLNSVLSGITSDMRDTIATDMPLNEKVTRIGTEVKYRVGPVLEKVAGRVREFIGVLAKRGEEALDSAKQTDDDSNGRAQ